MERSVRIGVYGMALAEGRVLLTKLWDRGSAAGLWTLPGGGMEFGEPPRLTLRREFQEETGLEPDIGHLLDIRSFMPRPSLQSIQVIYSVIVAGEPQVVEVAGSTVDVAWVPLADLDRIGVVDLVRHALELAPGNGDPVGR